MPADFLKVPARCQPIFCWSGASFWAGRTISKEGAEALVVLEVPVTIEHQRQISELAIIHRLPTLFPGGQASAGGLITFGTSILDAAPRIPGYVDRILKGSLETLASISRDLSILRTQRELGIEKKSKKRNRGK